MRAFGNVHERLHGIKRPGLDNDKPHRGVISQKARTILRSVGTCYRRRDRVWGTSLSTMTYRHRDFPCNNTVNNNRKKKRKERDFTLTTSSEKVAHSMDVIRVIAAVSMNINREKSPNFIFYINDYLGYFYILNKNTIINP